MIMQFHSPNVHICLFRDTITLFRITMTSQQAALLTACRKHVELAAWFRLISSVLAHIYSSFGVASRSPRYIFGVKFTWNAPWPFVRLQRPVCPFSVPVQTSNFSWAESNANQFEEKTLIINIRFVISSTLELGLSFRSYINVIFVLFTV